MSGLIERAHLSMETQSAMMKRMFEFKKLQICEEKTIQGRKNITNTSLQGSLAGADLGVGGGCPAFVLVVSEKN